MKLKKSTKVFLMIVLSAVLFQATLALSFAQGTANPNSIAEGFRIEELYQRKVREILNPILPGASYTLVVNLDSHATQAGISRKIGIEVILVEDAPLDLDSKILDSLHRHLPTQLASENSVRIVRAARMESGSASASAARTEHHSKRNSAFWVLSLFMMVSGCLLLVQRKKETPRTLDAWDELDSVAPVTHQEPLIEFHEVLKLEGPIVNEVCDESIKCKEPDFTALPEAWVVASDEGPVEEPAKMAVKMPVELTVPVEIKAETSASTLAVEFLNSLPAAREEQLIQFLKQHHPEAAERIRNARLLFTDIPRFSSPAVTRILEKVELHVWQEALAGLSSPEIKELLDCLPHEKALQIRTALHLNERPLNGSAAAESRRQICQILEHQAFGPSV